MSWETLEAELRRWHESRDRVAGRAALTFLEAELRLMVPLQVRRTWPEDLVEDALRDFLLKLVDVPLPPGIENPRRYLARAFRNHCIDLHEARRRRREVSVEDGPAGWDPPADGSESPTEIALQGERARQLHAALRQLVIADRIVLKLDHAPELLDDDEVRWLAARTEMDAAAIRQAVASSEDMHAITRIFDPGDDDPDDPEIRRKRMERFRRRRARARQKLRVLLREVQ
ncbi:MAG: hypothetical protein Q8K32_07170 [Archangium sp.]|nr:hypothetical protein [Archangium sp.]